MLAGSAECGWELQGEEVAGAGWGQFFHRDFHRFSGETNTNFHSFIRRWETKIISTGFDALEDLHGLIAATIVDEPPVSLADGGVIRAGVDAELDELRELGRSGRQALAAIEERERQRTGIGSLKVRFNSVFGYYLEVTKANSRSVPDDYERKQTLVNAERFTTPELKEYETKILTAQERSGEIERRIFAELRRRLLDGAGRMRATARRVAEIDLLACFAHLAALRGWCGRRWKYQDCLNLWRGGIRWSSAGWRNWAAGDLCQTRSRWRRGLETIQLRDQLGHRLR